MEAGGGGALSLQGPSHSWPPLFHASVRLSVSTLSTSHDLSHHFTPKLSRRRAHCPLWLLDKNSQSHILLLGAGSELHRWATFQPLSWLCPCFCHLLAETSLQSFSEPPSMGPHAVPCTDGPGPRCSEMRLGFWFDSGRYGKARSWLPWRRQSVTYSFWEKGTRHTCGVTPCGATRGSTGVVDPEVEETRAKLCPEPLLCFLWERPGRGQTSWA